MIPSLLAARATRRLPRRAKHAGIAVGVVALLAVAVVTAALGALPRMEQVVADQRVTAAAADIPPAYLAAYQQAARSAQPPIPWEILAGIGKVATDHGRRSPYDGADRATAPATDYPDVSPPIVAHPADPVAPSSPGGSGGVQTLSAVTATGAIAPDSELATDVNNVPVFLAGERQVESGGNYQASSGGASGAYQYINATWASEARSAGYPQYAAGPAAAAPPEVQDAVAGSNAQRLFATFHNWWWAAEAWYDPLWAGNPAEQASVPSPSAGNTLTMAAYAEKVYAAMAASTGTGAASATTVPTAGSVTTGGGSPSGPAVSGSGPLLLTPAGTVAAPGADDQDIDTEAGLLARASAPVEERRWQQMGLPSSIVERPLSDPDAQRFWSSVLAALPVAAGVGIGSVSDGEGSPPAGSPPAAGPPTAIAGNVGGNPMQRFATDLLTNLAVPVTPTNVSAVQAWASGEGSTARFNPLDTTQPEPGATPYNANGGDPVENYADYRSGITATVATLEPGGHPSPLYGGILTALQAGSSAPAVEGAIAASPWGTRHFPDPNFSGSANFPGFPSSIPPANEPVAVADLARPSPTGADLAVPAGVDTQPAADALTMAELYAGVISDPSPAAGRSYAPSPTTPAGFQVPAGTPPPVTQAIGMALAQLGKPYGYGAAGPDAYDCSGLVMAAYATAGISLPRTTYAQYLVGGAVPLGDPNLLRAGDLLFMMGSDPQGSAPGHVGMYLGAGQVIEAPYTGTVIRISPLASWLPKLVSVRRVVPS